MSNEDLTIGEEIAYRTRERQIKARSMDKAESRHLTVVEKLAFSVAATFSTVILLAAIFLTVMGFIFSPIVDTLLFALLMGAAGMTSYVIWKNGR